jgi:hypothetical protein
MSISFHCERCKKKVKAPDSAGGKYGNCPFCKHKCYIPLPASDDEPELRLAPIDEGEEDQYSRMMRETHNLSQNILHETATGGDGEDAGGAVDDKEVLKTVVIYLRMMADGELEQAERLAGKMKRYGEQVKEILRRMAKAERREPELEGIPPKLLDGLMKNLFARM